MGEKERSSKDKVTGTGMERVRLSQPYLPAASAELCAAEGRSISQYRCDVMPIFFTPESLQPALSQLGAVVTCSAAEFVSGAIQSPPGLRPVQPALGAPALVGRLD